MKNQPSPRHFCYFKKSKRVETIPHHQLTDILHGRSDYRTRTRSYQLIYTLIVDGKKMSIGSADAFKHFRSFRGITIELATDNDIETLPIHPGTPRPVRDSISELREPAPHATTQPEPTDKR